MKSVIDTIWEEKVVIVITKLTPYKVNFLHHFSPQIKMMLLQFHMLNFIH